MGEVGAGQGSNSPDMVPKAGHRLEIHRVAAPYAVLDAAGVLHLHWEESNRSVWGLEPRFTRHSEPSPSPIYTPFPLSWEREMRMVRLKPLDLG